LQAAALKLPDNGIGKQWRTDLPLFMAPAPTNRVSERLAKSGAERFQTTCKEPETYNRSRSNDFDEEGPMTSPKRAMDKELAVGKSLTASGHISGWKWGLEDVADAPKGTSTEGDNV
jgi:hypothetical protein